MDAVDDKLARYDLDRDDSRTIINREGLYRPLAVVLRSKRKATDLVIVLLYQDDTVPGGWRATVECPQWKVHHSDLYAQAAIRRVDYVRRLRSSAVRPTT